MKFTMKQVKALIKEAVEDEPLTGDDILDKIYEETMPSIVGHTQPYYSLWYLLASELKPKMVVELGSWRAYGAAHFAVGNPDGQVVTIDIHNDADQVDDHRIAKEMAERYSNLFFVHKWTWHAVADVKAYGKPIDILFIDAWHKYEFVIREWEAYEPLLADHALVIYDDVMDAEGATENMNKVWDEIAYPKFLDTDLHVGIPMGFVEYKRKK